MQVVVVAPKDAQDALWRAASGVGAAGERASRQGEFGVLISAVDKVDKTPSVIAQELEQALRNEAPKVVRLLPNVELADGQLFVPVDADLAAIAAICDRVLAAPAPTERVAFLGRFRGRNAASAATRAVELARARWQGFEFSVDRISLVSRSATVEVELDGAQIRRANLAKLGRSLPLTRSRSLHSKETTTVNENDVHVAHARAFAIADDRWIVGVTKTGGTKKKPDVAFHLCLDNSGSMGYQTEAMKDAFAEILDGMPCAPSSLTVFAEKAETLSADLDSGDQVRALRLPRQGRTNISAGVQAMIDCVLASSAQHHVLVLLSDGAHNVGPAPSQVFEAQGQRLKDAGVRASVVVVGLTAGSQTSVGMLLRSKAETVCLDELQPIYFVKNMRNAREALKGLGDDLRATLFAGGLVKIQDCTTPSVVEDRGGFVVDADKEPTNQFTQFHVGDEELAFVYAGVQPPRALCVDASFARVRRQDDVDVELAAAALRSLIGWYHVQKVGGVATQHAARTLEQLADALEAALARARQANTNKDIDRKTRQGRLETLRRVAGTLNVTRELKNELASAAALATNDSETQAAFLTGAHSKFAGKALVRAAKRAGQDQSVETLHASMLALVPKMRRALELDAADRASGDTCSYLSLMTNREHLTEWTEDVEKLNNEFEYLAVYGMLGTPCVVMRRDATVMDPFACEIAKLDVGSTCDTASLCCALRAGQDIAPPEGGRAVKDVLCLVDPELPRASLLAITSAVGERLVSVTIGRDLHFYTGIHQVVALHAHGLQAALSLGTELDDADVEAQLRRAYEGRRVYQCAKCGFGPVDHHHCGDLASHHGEIDAPGVQASNACPRCGWFAEDLDDWEPWNGRLDDVTITNARLARTTKATNTTTEAHVRLALRIGYSMRKIWTRYHTSAASHAELFDRLASWQLDALTPSNDVSHVVQLLLVLWATKADGDVDDSLWADALRRPTAVAVLLQEACARQAWAELSETARGSAPMAKLAGRDKARAALGISAASAPQPRSVDECEPQGENVRAKCDASFTLSDNRCFEEWVVKTIEPYARVFGFCRRLQRVIAERGGGWSRLDADLERGDVDDIVAALAGAEADAPQLFNEENLDVKKRQLATVYAMAFANAHSSHRKGRMMPDPTDASATRDLAIELRLDIYHDAVAKKMQEWRRVGADVTVARARAADIGQYENLVSKSPHVHGLDGPTFWGLWFAAKADGHGGSKVRAFLQTANREFRAKHAPDVLLEQ